MPCPCIQKVASTIYVIITGRYVKNNLAVRKELRHYLASSFENAIADNTTFAILTSLYFDIDNQTTQVWARNWGAGRVVEG